MEDVIVYAIVAIIVIVNIVRTYQKEAAKNKERSLVKPVRSATSSAPASTPAPTPFSRPQQKEKTPKKTEYTEVFQNTSSMKSEHIFADEGVSAMQQYIDSKSKEGFNDNEKFEKSESPTEDSFDLKLETAEDFKRAFVHTLIFERKY